jgi:hypothetical protein
MAMQFVELAELTQASLVCEDLAQNDDIAQLIRLVGPTVVICGLLDGPQLNSRWAARYASVLADDPGSAVLTLASLGMVERSRPQGRDPSRVIALWKDSSTGVREIPLDSGAHGVLLTVTMDRATRRSADGRWPVGNGTSCCNAAVYQVRASSVGSEPTPSRSTTPTAHILETEELTILTAWAEGVSEAAAYHPSALTPCSPRHTEARRGEPSSGFRSYPPDSLTRWNRSAESFALLLRFPPAYRYSTKCSPQSARITPAKEDSTDWFGARCSRCWKNEQRGDRPKCIGPGDSEEDRPDHQSVSPASLAVIAGANVNAVE